MGLLDEQRRQLLDGTAYSDPGTPTGTSGRTGSRIQVRQSYDDKTLDYLMQQLVLTNRRIMLLESSLALVWALLKQEL